MTIRPLRSHAMKSASVGVDLQSRVEVIGLDEHRSMMDIAGGQILRGMRVHVARHKGT